MLNNFFGRPILFDLKTKTKDKEFISLVFNILRLQNESFSYSTVTSRYLSFFFFKFRQSFPLDL